MSIRSLFLSIVLLFPVSFAGAQEMEYRSSLLKELASKVQKLSSGTLGDREVITEFDDAGRVSNIGLDVFGTDNLELYSEDICRFIERYFLELLCWDKTTVQQKLFDDKVNFVIGSPYDVTKIDDSLDFSFNLFDDKYYVASWSRDGKDVLSVQFPVQYELLLGMTQVEMENGIKDDLMSQNPVEDAPVIPEAEMISSGLFRSIPVNHYLLKDLNDCTYYIDAGEDDLIPLYDENHLPESLANLFHLNVGENFTMSVTQSLYGFKFEKYEITVSQWRSYCRRNNLKTYFAIEKEDEEYLQAFILCENKDLAYNHVLSVIVPKSFMEDKDVSLIAKLHAFIPVHNVAELYNSEELVGNE